MHTYKQILTNLFKKFCIFSHNIIFIKKKKKMTTKNKIECFSTQANYAYKISRK